MRDRSRRGTPAALALAALGVLAAACGSDATPPPAAAPPPDKGDPVVASCSAASGAAPAPGERVAPGSRGPWAVENCVYGGASGIREGWIVDVTTDEAQNRWIATPAALYLATPGGALRRYDELDGLHLGEATGRTPGPVGWVKYCDMVPVAPDAPCSGDLVWGGATQYGIRSLAGGGPNEVFVGYHGGHTPGITCDGGPDWCDPLRHSGKIDRVRLNRDGSITVDRIDWWINHHDLGYWHNRTPFRLLYDHFFHPGTLYAAADHGIVIVFPDKFVPYPSALGKAGLDDWLDDFLGDHLHAQVCFHQSCASGGHPRAGDWRGLAFDAQGRLWHAGQYTAGAATWDPDPLNWWGRWGDAFVYAFGDPYVLGDGNEPVFKVPLEGDSVYLTAVSVCPDGRVWFGSAGPTGVNETVAVFDAPSYTFRAFDARALGLGERAVEDLLCLPDGRLVIAGQTAGAVVYDPAKGTSTPLRGLPGKKVVRLSLDTMVSPPSLLVATDGGAAVLRQLP
jgi:hypothetical protein